MTTAERAGAALAAELEAYRPRLFSLAYRLLGSASEAEDVLQDAYLRLATSPAAEEPPRDAGAYLRTVVTRLCLDRLKSARARRETYVGPWLPEPVITADPAPLPLESVEQRESLSLAALVLLERLSPAERAVLVLHDAFGYRHGEIAAMLQATPVACRQWLHRAHARVADGRRPATLALAETERERESERHRRLTERLLAACGQGDVQGLAELLAEDVTLWSDGGGLVAAARRPVVGRDNVARFFVGLARQAPPDLHITVAEVNGEPAALVWLAGQVSHVFALEVAHGRVVTIRAVVNPMKLAYLRRQLAESETPD